MTALAKVADQDKLKPRRDPYWTRIKKGCFVGYRRMSPSSEGRWLARCLIDGKQHWKPLSEISDLPASDRYDAAVKKADEWFKHLGMGGSAEAQTVRAICERYVTHLRETKGDTAADEAQGRFDRYVYSDKKLPSIEATKLTPAHLEAWRKTLRGTATKTGARCGEKRTDSSLNRDMVALRAALNLAYRDGLVTSDFAWRSKLLPIKNADRRREVYLDASQRRKLVSHAAEDVADLLRALSLVPLRPGALASLTAGSYDKRLKTLTIGKDKSGQDRKLMLPDATAKFFAKQAKDKLPAAPLLARSNGAAWNKDAWKYPVKDAVVAAGLPTNITAYAIRHSVITDLVHGGLDTLTVAQLSGTSVLMIEKHYGHLTREHAREALSRLKL